MCVKFAHKNVDMKVKNLNIIGLDLSSLQECKLTLRFEDVWVHHVWAKKKLHVKASHCLALRTAVHGFLFYVHFQIKML